MYIYCSLQTYVKYLTNFLLSALTDGAPGDGTTIGKCPSAYSTYRCLSTGECKECKLISGLAEGCDIHSSTPVCDADSTSPAIEDSAIEKISHCVGCKKSGKCAINMCSCVKIVFVTYMNSQTFL